MQRDAAVETLAMMYDERCKELAEAETYISIRKYVDQLAIRKWRDAHPWLEGTAFPSHVDLCTWLMHRLDGTTLTFKDEDGLWEEMFGKQYQSVKYRRLEAGSPETVRSVVAKLHAGEPCPEAADVIAATVHSEMLSQQCQRHMSARMREQEGEIQRLRQEVSRYAEGLPAIVDQT